MKLEVRYFRNIINSFLRFVSSDLFLKIALIWFTVQAIYFAVAIKFGIPPDEHYHFEFIKLFSANHFSPFINHQADVGVLKEVIRLPYFLYHYLISIPYTFFSTSSYAYIVLRLVSVVLGLLSLGLVVKIADYLKINKLVRNTTVFMLSNTVMFVFIFSSISYDAPFIFLCLASIYLLLKIRKHTDAQTLLLLFITLTSGLMIKKNFVPFAFIIAITTMLIIRKKWPLIAKSFKKISKRTFYILLGLSLLLTLLFVHRYGYNLVRYRALEPGCARVRTITDCRKSELFVRNEKIYSSSPTKATQSVEDYVFKWSKLMQDRTYGIFAHKRYAPNKYISIGLMILALFSILCAARYWRKKDSDITFLMVISFFYILVLFIQNYNSYLHTGILELGIHGRYLFGILPIIFLVFTNYLYKPRSRNYKFALTIIIMLLFFVSGFPTFFIKTGPDWF